MYWSFRLFSNSFITEWKGGMYDWFFSFFFHMQYVHFLQRKYSLGSFNLLGHTAPVQASSLLLLGPFLDYWMTNKRVDAYDYSLVSVVSISKFHTRLFLHSIALCFHTRISGSSWFNKTNFDILRVMCRLYLLINLSVFRVVIDVM